MNEATKYLEQMQYLNVEINQLESKISELSADCFEYGTSGVEGSSKSKPYAKHNIIVGGYARSERVQAQIKELGQTYTDKLEALYKGRREAEKILDSIEDSKARTIIRYYYIDGMTWKQVADELYKSDGKSTDDSVKKYCQRILNNL